MENSDTIFSQGTFELLIASGQLFIALLIGVLTAIVYFYSRRRDKLEFFYNNWNKQQDINLGCLTNDLALSAVEDLVYGGDAKVELEDARQYTLAFLHINKIQNNYEAYKGGILKKYEYENMSIPTLQLFARKKPLIHYLITQRGYSQDFQESVMDMLLPLQPYDVPTFEGEQDFSEYIASKDQQVSKLEKALGLLDNFLDSKTFSAISLAFVLNPILLGAQFIELIRSSYQTDVSLITFAGFAILNVITTLIGIKIRNWVMIVSYFISFIICVAISIAILIA